MPEEGGDNGSMAGDWRGSTRNGVGRGEQGQRANHGPGWRSEKARVTNEDVEFRGKAEAAGSLLPAAGVNERHATPRSANSLEIQEDDDEVELTPDWPVRCELQLHHHGCGLVCAPGWVLLTFLSAVSGFAPSALAPWHPERRYRRLLLAFLAGRGVRRVQ